MSLTKNKSTKSNLNKLEPHPLGSIFPPMSDEEYASLKKGMKENGFDPRHPIILFEGKILEGNHRYTSAKTTKVKPVFEQFEKLPFTGSPIEYVVQENLRRRNLTPSQLAALGADMVEQMEKAEQMAKETANVQPKKRAGEKVKKAASITKVSPRSIATVRSIKKKNPKAVEEIKRGKKTVHKAAKETEEKVSAAQAKTEEHERAVERIDKICGKGFTLKTLESNGHIKSKDVIAISELDKDEIARIHPFLESGWKLKDALGYKSVVLSMKHTLAQARDFAISKGGSAAITIDGWEYTIEKM